VGLQREKVCGQFWLLVKTQPINKFETSNILDFASNAARFEEAYKRIASECDIPGHQDPQVNVMQLVRNWLESVYMCNWLMVIDNVDNANTFFRETVK